MITFKSQSTTTVPLTCNDMKEIKIKLTTAGSGITSATLPKIHPILLTKTRIDVSRKTTLDDDDK